MAALFPPQIGKISGSGFFGLPLSKHGSGQATLTLAASATGPFVTPVPNADAQSYIAGFGSGAPAGGAVGAGGPLAVGASSALLAVLGTIQDSVSTTKYFVVALPGAFAVNYFSQVQLTHSAPHIVQTFLTSGDPNFIDFNVTWKATGYSVWTWSDAQGDLIAGVQAVLFTW